MKKLFIAMILALCIWSTLLARGKSRQLPRAPRQAKYLATLLGKQLKQLQAHKIRRPKPAAPTNELVIGQADPNEVVTLTGSQVQIGNIVIVNNGTLNLDHTDFRLDGDIQISGTGRLNITGGSLTIIQRYTYEHQAIVLENGTLKIEGVDFQSSGQSWGVAALGQGKYTLRNSKISNGFITTTLFQKATSVIENNDLPGEFLCLGENNLQLRRNDRVLFWSVLFDSSVVDMVLPDDSLLVHWQLSGAEPGVSGMPYTATIDSCTHVWWGLISQSGSQATFRDAHFRAVGLMFKQPDSIVVKNITNGSSHTDEMVSVRDRKLRLVNSEVQTWNFYPFARSNVTIEDCIFGEIISGDSAQVLVTNSICDGSGGHLAAGGHSLMILVSSLINSQALAEEDGVLVAAYSAMIGSKIVASDFSVMALLNTSHAVSPILNQGGNVFEEQMPSVEGFTHAQVPIMGTAQIITGPSSPLRFEGYTVEYADDPEHPQWKPINHRFTRQVVDDTLAVWNTAGLLPGAYALKLAIFHNFGDSVALVSGAQLQPQITGISRDDPKNPNGVFLAQNYPNPFNPATVIRYRLPAAGHVRLVVFDMLGREIETLFDGWQPAGEHRAKWDGTNATGHRVPSGIYVYKIKMGNRVQQRKMLLLH